MAVRSLLVVAILGAALPAHAEVGVVLGARQTSLDGNTTSQGRMNLGVGIPLAYSLGHGFEVGVEPGIRLSGTSLYRLIYVASPVVARYIYPVSRTVRLRALAGVVAGYLMKADARVYVESYEWESIDGVARGALEVVLGLGADLPYRNGHLLWEVRASRGLINVDSSDGTLFTQEIGLWVGYVR